MSKKVYIDFTGRQKIEWEKRFVRPESGLIKDEVEVQKVQPKKETKKAVLNKPLIVNIASYPEIIEQYSLITNEEVLINLKQEDGTIIKVHPTLVVCDTCNQGDSRLIAYYNDIGHTSCKVKIAAQSKID